MDGDEDASRVARVMAIILVVACGLFIIMTRSFFSITLLSYSILGLIFMIIQVCSFDSGKENNCHLSFLYFNEWAVWFGMFAFFYLFGTFNDFLFPLYIAASDKIYWNSSYWYNLYYGVFYGFFITFLVLLTIFVGMYAITALVTFRIEGNMEESGHRMVSTMVIVELLCALGLAFVLKFEGIWLSGYFPILLYATIAMTVFITLPWLFYAPKKVENETVVIVGITFFAILTLFHLIMMIILFSNINLLYARTPAHFSYGFDSSYLKNVLGEEKFYFFGDAEALTTCPKTFTVYNWEDPSNQFGCLSMKAFYKGRYALCLLLDILIALPFFEGVFMLSVALNDITFNNLNDFYVANQEKFRTGVSWFIAVGLVGSIITLICLSNFTQSAYFIYSAASVDGVTLDNSKLTSQILPSKTQLSWLANGLNEDQARYQLNGTVYDSEALQVVFEYKTQEALIPSEITTRTNAEFTLPNLALFPSSVPIVYNYRLLNPTDRAKVYRTGSFIVGGLATGKYIQLGQIPLNPKPSGMGHITGTIFDANNLTPIEGATVFVVRGKYYPSSVEELSSSTSFKLKDSIGNGTSFYNGFFIVFDLPYEELTLIVYYKGYYLELKTFVCTGKMDISNIFLSKIHTETALEVRVEWPTNVDLNLFASFPVKDSRSCLVGYLNQECGGGKYATTASTDRRNGGVEIITFDKIGNTEYSFYVHNYQRKSQPFISSHFAEGFWPEEKSETTLNLEMEKTQAKVKVFMPDFKFPFLNGNVPFGTSGKRWRVLNLKVEANALKFSILDNLI